MSLGKQVRLNRIFGHASGRLCSVAVDHFIGYSESMAVGLSDLARSAQGRHARQARRRDHAQGRGPWLLGALRGQGPVDRAEHRPATR